MPCTVTRIQTVNRHRAPASPALAGQLDLTYGPDRVSSLVEGGEGDGGRERAVPTQQPRPAAGNSSCLVGPRLSEEHLEALTRVVSDGVSQHGRRKVPAPQPDHVNAGSGRQEVRDRSRGKG